MSDLTVGFFRFDAYLLSGCAPAPTPYITHVLNAPETRETIMEKIAACEKLLVQLRVQLEAMP